MILVTGPTGSGKTATLYAALQLLNTLEKNICTVEDPIEVTVPGINQINIDSKINLTFTKVLRAFLRQDPDILMIGEIRDQETAETAIKAAQTGHLVLSTLHTNSASETLTRLYNLNISPFHIADTVQLIIAQRLIRKLCQYCQQANLIDKELSNYLSSRQCKHCLKGYHGRIGLFECLFISTNLSNLIRAQKSISEITKAAKKEGFISLKEIALHQINKGVTNLAEIQRVLI